MRWKLLVMIMLLSIAGAAAADTDLKIVLLDGSVIQGTLVGSDSQMLTLDVNGKSREYPLSSVKKAFDATTGAPYALNNDSAAAQPASAEAPDEAPQGQEQYQDEDQQAPPRFRRRGRGRRAPRQIQLRSEHEWVDVDFGFEIGANTGDDSAINTLWQQVTPSGFSSYEAAKNPLAMAADFDVLVRPLPWFAIGPFVKWNFSAPGADATDTYYSSYYGFYGASVREQLDFSSFAYGARARILFPLKNPRGMEAGRFGLDLSLGELALSDAGYTEWINGYEDYHADFTGTAPFVGLGASFDGVLSRNLAVNLGLGVDMARVSKIDYDVTNDYYGGGAGQSGTVKDGNGNDIFADLSNVYFKVAFISLF